MVHQREVNTEGLEKNFATNTMGGAYIYIYIPNCFFFCFFCFKCKTTAKPLECFFSICLFLGMYVLTQSLIPLLLKSRDPRVVQTHSHWSTQHNKQCSVFRNGRMALLSDLKWLLSKHTLPLSSIPVRSLCPQGACWSRNSEWMICSLRWITLTGPWSMLRTR